MPDADPRFRADDLVFERADYGQPEVVDAVLTLLSEYLDRPDRQPVAAARLRWLYLDNPHGQARTWIVRDRHRGTLVAMTSIFPRWMSIDGEPQLSAIGGDTYVTPSHRRRGIASRLHRAMLGTMHTSPIRSMYAVATPGNVQPMESGGAAVVGTVRRFIRPLNVAGLGSRAVSLPRPAAWCINRCLRPRPSRIRSVELGSEPDPRVDALWRSYARSPAMAGRVVPQRDAQYIAWRYGAAPSRRQRALLLLREDDEVAAAMAAVEVAQRKLIILDLVAAPEDAKPCLQHLMRCTPDVDQAEIRMFTPSPLERPARRSGFVGRDSTAFHVQSPSDRRNRGNVDLHGRPWHYLLGDADVDQIQEGVAAIER